MKRFKLIVTGTENDIEIEFLECVDFVNYRECDYAGTVEEKYAAFLSDLQANGGPQPILIKAKMLTKTVDRAFTVSDILKMEKVQNLVENM